MPFLFLFKLYLRRTRDKVVFFHQTSAIITGLQDQGYELVPVSELIYKDDYRLDVNGRQFSN